MKSLFLTLLIDGVNYNSSIKNYLRIEKGEYPYESNNSWGDSQEHCGVTYGDLPVLYLNGKMLLV